MDHAVLETSSDRYVIQEYLAEGGMGAIYLGKKLGVGGFEKEVILKQLLPEFTSEPQFVDLFLREARISASLDHANIVHTIDLVAAEKDFFIVMEYVRGADLRTVMRRAKRRGKQLSPQAALHMGHEIADALAYAHNKVKPDGAPLGLIHRDVSPSNILLSGSGEVKLTDFGIAKASTHRSVFYRVKGKVGYMSPEQARGETIDARSDVYSLAVCIYEALVGERLFVADMMSTPSMIYSQPIPRVSTLRSGLPVELDVVLAKALSLRADDRFQSAAELQEAIRSVAFRSGLMYSSMEMAAHLADACGTDTAAWLRSDVGDERGGGTELYENEDEPSDEEEAEELDSDDLVEDKPKSQVQLKGGTQLTSIFAIRERARAAGRPDPTLPDAFLVEKPAGPADSQPILSPPPLRARTGSTTPGARSKWETESTRHYPGGRPPGVADPHEESTRAYPDGKPPGIADPISGVGPSILDDLSVDRTHPTPPPVDLDSEDRTRPKPQVELERIKEHDPLEPNSDEQTIAEVHPPVAAHEDLRRPPPRPERSPGPRRAAPPPPPSVDLPPPVRRPQPEIVVEDSPPRRQQDETGKTTPFNPREPTGKTLPFNPVPRSPDMQTPPIAPREVSGLQSIGPSDPTVVPSRRQALGRNQRTSLIPPRSGMGIWRSRRLIIGIVTLVLLAVGIALGVALSDPGAEKDDGVSTPK
jgi:serine/threonine protein kinase